MSVGTSENVPLRRPRIKPEHRPYRLADKGLIRIGGPVFGIASEIEDEAGSIWTLLEAMDGSRDVAGLVEAVHATHPEETAADVRGAIETLAASGFVEDVAIEAPASLSARELERYDRGRMYFRWMDLSGCVDTWTPQIKLRNASVLLLGVGGTGGAAATALAASGVGRLHLVDRDWVELSNLNRQVLFRESDIGQPKVEVALRELRALNSDIEITGEQREITCVEDIESLLTGHDLLVMCADRPAEIRTWANRAALAAGVPWVDAGYHGPRVGIGIFRPGQGGCYECLWKTGFEMYSEHIGVEQDYSTARNGPAAVAAPSACLSGHYAAHFALAMLTGSPPTPAGQIRMMNLVDTADVTVIDHPRRHDCDACAPQSPELGD